MNSLVVLLSVMALAVASPSGLLAPAPLAYSATVLAAAPAAVSSQSRLDIKSSPAIVSTSYAAAPVSYAAAAPIASLAYTAPVAAAAIAPAAVSHQSRIDIKSSPAVISTSYAAAPIAYSSPVAYSALGAAAVIAPAAVSHQSHVDIKSSPAVFSTSYAATPVSYGAAAPIAYSAPLINTAAVATPVIASTGYTAAIAPTLPLDTPEVIAARAAHFEAHALAGAHLIQKRSAPLFATPLVSTYSSPIAYSAPIAPVTSYASYTPLTYSSPLINKVYSVNSW